MAGIKKLVGITGLNPSHPLVDAVATFIDVADIIKSYPSGTMYTSTSTIIDDVDLGLCRQFNANADAISPPVNIPFNSTVLAVYKYLGGASQGAPINDTFFFEYIVNGNQFTWQTASTSTEDYWVNRRFAFGTSVTTRYEPYNQNLTLKRTPRASAVSYSSGTPFFYSDGIAFTPTSGGAGAVGTPSLNPIPVTLMPKIGSNGAMQVSAFIVFNRVLTSTELEDITQNPWDLVVGTPPLEVSLVPEDLSPNTLVTASFTNYVSLPTSVDVVDTLGNTLNVPLSAVDSTTATFVMPDLNSSNSVQNYVQFGDVDLVFGDKTITTTFNTIPPIEYITLIAPVETNAFEAWGLDVPVAGEQLISQSNFDVNGNFTGADPDEIYVCWITRLDGTNYQFTIQQGVVANDFTATLPAYSEVIGYKSLSLITGSSFIPEITSKNYGLNQKVLAGVFGISFTSELPTNNLHYTTSILDLTAFGVGYSMDLPVEHKILNGKSLQFVSFKNIPLDSRRIYYIK